MIFNYLFEINSIEKSCVGTNLKIFKKVLLTSSLFAFSSATFAGSDKLSMPQKIDLESKSIFEKPFSIAENIEDDPVSYVGKDTLKITVTGTRTERLLKDFPGSISVYDYEEINNSNSINWRDLFKYDASIESQAFVRSDNSRTYAKGDSGNINIRGLQGNRILTQVDGITIPRFNYGSGTFSASRLNFIDFSNLGKIEVLKGSGSSLYGSDALGGVVSLRTLRPDDLFKEGEDYKFDISSKYNGSNNLFSPSIKAAFKEDKNEFLISGSLTSFEELNRKTDKTYINDINGDMNSYLAKWISKLDNDGEFNLSLELIDKDLESIASGYNSTGNYTASNDFTNSRRTTISAGLDWFAEKDSFIDAVKLQGFSNEMQYDNEWQVRNSADTSDNENTVDDLTQNSYGGSIQFTNDIKGAKFDQKITYGLQGSLLEGSRLRSKYEGSSLALDSQYKSNPDTDTTQLGIYVQDEISFDKWDFILGMRYDHNKMDAKSDNFWLASDESGANSSVLGEPHDFDDGHLAPSVKAIYKINENTNVYGKYDRGFRAPSWDEFNSSRIGIFPIAFHPIFRFPTDYSGYATIGNPDLKAETSDSFEIGLKKNTKNANFTIAAFYNSYNDFLEKSASDGTVDITTPAGVRTVSRLRTKNVDDASIFGFELNSIFNFVSTGFSIGNSFSYQKGDNNTDNEPLHSIQPFTAVNSINYKFPNQRISTSLINTYVGKPITRSDYSDFIPDSYIITDLNVGYEVSQNFSVNFGVYNLLNKTYYKWNDIVANGSAGTDDIAYQRYAQPGTSIQAGFNWRF